MSLLDRDRPDVAADLAALEQQAVALRGPIGIADVDARRIRPARTTIPFRSPRRSIAGSTRLRVARRPPFSSRPATSFAPTFVRARGQLPQRAALQIDHAGLRGAAVLDLHGQQRFIRRPRGIPRGTSSASRARAARMAWRVGDIQRAASATAASSTKTQSASSTATAEIRPSRPLERRNFSAPAKSTPAPHGASWMSTDHNPPTLPRFDMYATRRLSANHAGL